MSGHDEAVSENIQTLPTSLTEGYGRSTGLVDVLDRVLDKGLVTQAGVFDAAAVGPRVEAASTGETDAR